MGAPQREVGFRGRQGWVGGWGAWGLPCSATPHPAVPKTPQTAPSIAGKCWVTAALGKAAFPDAGGEIWGNPWAPLPAHPDKGERGPRLPRCRMFSEEVGPLAREVESFISKTKVHSANQDYKEQG